MLLNVALEALWMHLLRQPGCVHAEECQRIVEEAITGSMFSLDFLDHLKGAGVTTEEARDYIDQYSQHRRDQEVAGAADEGGQSSDQPNLDDPNPNDTATSVAWALLCAKVSHLQPTSPQAASTPGKSLLGLSGSKGAIPASVLMKVLHLSKLSNLTTTDPHLEKTQDLLLVYSPQSFQDILVNKAQFAPVGNPLPCTIWCKILLNLFIDFEKLFASMDKGYDHHDEPKDFGAGYVLVKKDQAFSKCLLWTEADWIRVFGAWLVGVAFFLPHQDTELWDYQTFVMDLFQAAPTNPLVAISFDVQVHDKYLKKLFHLDDQAQLNLPLLAQMLSSPLPANPLCGGKRVISSQASMSGNNPKCVDVPSCNWSFGTCKSEVCPNHPKHGVCCICGEGHRANDNEQCFTLFQTCN
ncbi:hypothetical protein L208DRAFT_1557284 [Tricholoma matsutake]|nr:hypothetical protein L208DRAFT_1557284 [Tricholoma matsutake 945]